MDSGIRDFVAPRNDTLAVITEGLGDLARAEALLRQVVELTRQTEGEKNPHFARRLTNLGVVEHKLGNLAQARALLEQATQITRAVIRLPSGSRRPSTPTSSSTRST